jgi:hypothetical protein
MTPYLVVTMRFATLKLFPSFPIATSLLVMIGALKKTSAMLLLKPALSAKS